MKKIRRIAFSLLLIGFAIGCRYDKAELIYPNNSGPSCDTTNVRYSIEVTSILSDNCYVCHGGTALGGAGIQLGNYASLRQMVLNGKLMNSISHRPGASAMPRGSAKLPDCTIAKIQAWVNKGAPQN